MNTLEKLKILSGAAKYDASCASSGSNRRNNPKGIGNTAVNGICHSWSEDGRCISLLKLLFTNFCIYDCAYCANRRSNDIPRAAFTVDEVVDLTIDFFKRNYIEGLFLSSAVFGSPDITLEKLVQITKKLRTERGFNGYIHLKVMPGASDMLFNEAGRYADRLSVNIELPSEKSLIYIAPDKKKENILLPMEKISKKIYETNEERKKTKKIPVYSPGGQSTQLIVGASPEDDKQIMRLTNSLYNKFHLKRVYYSAHVSVNDDSRLIFSEKPDMMREHRLYQADWLLRVYGFKLDDLVFSPDGTLSRDYDPKMEWAFLNIHLFPMEINKVEFEQLIRIPGIGFRTATKIINTRRFKSLDFEDLKKTGAVLKRARYFITCNGKRFDQIKIDPQSIKTNLLMYDKKPKSQQLSLFAM
jgi:putative DNA modification/repair radical SAM protein